MPFAFRFTLQSMVLSLSLVCSGLLTVQSSTSAINSFQSADESAVRAVVEKYFALFAGKDPDRLMSLWSEKAPDFASVKQDLQRHLMTENYKLSLPTVSRVSVEGEKANLRATFNLTTIDLESHQQREQRIVRNLTLVWENEKWKIWRSVPAVNDLAAALAEAADETKQERLLTQEKELMDSSLLVALNEVTAPLIQKGDFGKALKISQLAARIAEMLGDRRGLGDALTDLGAIHGRQNLATQALDYLQKSRVIYEETNDQKGMARVLYEIGRVHLSQSRLDQAMEQFNRSLAISEAIGEKSLTALALNVIGIIHISQGRNHLALECYQKSRALSEALNDKVTLEKVLNNIGELYYREGPERLRWYGRKLAMP